MVAAIVLVVEYTLAIVSSAQGVPESSASPAQRSTRGCPSIVIATLAPCSRPCAKLVAIAWRTGSNRSSQNPWISVIPCPLC